MIYAGSMGCLSLNTQDKAANITVNGKRNRNADRLSVAIFAWIWMLPLKSWAANQLTDPDDQRCVEIYGWTSM